MINVRDYGATGDGVTDDTAAFLAARDAVQSKMTSLPLSAGGSLSIATGGKLYVPGGVYRLSSRWALPQRSSLVMDPDAYLVFGPGCDGLVIESNYINSIGDIDASGGHVYSLDTSGDYSGIRCEGGAYSLFHDIDLCGWGTGFHVEVSNGITLRDSIISAWSGMGVQAGTGVRFALRQQLGGTATNGNVVERCQMNGRGIAVWSEDGSGNVVSRCNFNSPDEVARIEGTQGLDIVDCQAEGVKSNAYVRFGSPQWYSQGRIVAMRLSLARCAFSRNEPQLPAILFMERNATVWDLDISGMSVFIDRNSPLIHCAQPWPTMSYIVIRSLIRKGVLVGGASLPGPGLPGGNMPLAVGDRPQYGTDGGP